MIVLFRELDGLILRHETLYSSAAKHFFDADEITIVAAVVITVFACNMLKPHIAQCEVPAASFG
jgi:hypothetical protein